MPCRSRFLSPLSRRSAALSLGTLAALLGACAAPPPAPVEYQAPEVPIDGFWSPSTDVALPHTTRGRLYTLVHSSDADLLIFEQNLDTPDGVSTRATWLIRVPRSAPLSQPLDLAAPVAASLTEPAWRTADGSAPVGWLIETRAGAQAHAAPVSGVITIDSRSADAVLARLSLHADRVSPSAGMERPSRVTLDRRMGFSRHAPRTIRTEQDVQTAQ